MRTSRPLAATVLLLLLLVPAASAHAVLKSSVPAKGSRLDYAPNAVSVTLTEPADPAGTSLQVLDAQGGRVDLDDLTITGDANPTLHASLRPDLPAGAYRIQWRALSGADGHATSGTIGFAVGDFAAPDSQASDVSEIVWLSAAGRFLAFLGIALALGAALFLAWVPGGASVPRRPVVEVLLVAGALHLVGVVCLLKSTLNQTGLSASGLAASAIGKALMLRLAAGVGALAFAAIAAAPRVQARGPPILAVLLLAVSGLGSARFGHASLAGLAGVAVDAIHLFAAAAWTGGLLVFLWLLAEARRLKWPFDAIRLAGIRFGTAALACVVALLAAGVGASLAILGADAVRHPLATLGSTWGRVLAGKVALTLGMVAIAAVNRYGLLEPATEAGVAGRVQRVLRKAAPSLRPLDGDASSLRRLLRVEALLGVAVLALAGILTSISPPSAAYNAGAGAEPLTVFGSGEDFHGELTIDPAPVAGGTSRLAVHLETHLGEPLVGNTCGRESPSCVRAIVVAGGANGTGESHELTPTGDGTWTADGVLWTVAGPAEVRVVVTTAQRDDTLAFAFAVAG